MSGEIVVFNVVDDVESVLNRGANVELGLEVVRFVHLPPDFFVDVAAVELGVAQSSVEVF